MKKTMCLVISIVLAILPCNVWAAPSVSNDGISQIITYKHENSEYTDNEIYEMVQVGTEFKNDIIKVESIPDQSQFRNIVNITRKLKTTVLSDGSIIDTFSILSTGEAYEDKSDAYVRIRVGLRYDTQTYGGSLCIRITEHYCDTWLLNSSYTLTKLVSNASQSGNAYDTFGNLLGGRRETSSFTQNNPSSGTRYYKEPGFQRWMTDGLLVTAYWYNDCTLTYKRNSDGATYTLKYKLNL
jgi:hypothetical protein